MKYRSINQTLWRFGFKQTIRGALIVGILSGLMMGAYGIAIVKVYPSQQSRQELVQTLKLAPAVNFLSGEVKDAGTPASYSIYKSLPMMVLLTSIWGLLIATKLLRGAEEDGRLESLVSGAVTRMQVARQLLLGFGSSLLLASGIMWMLTAALGSAPGVGLSPLQAFYMTLAVFLPGFVFTSVGVLTSQLTLTRSKATMYGLIPLIVLFAIRGIANTSEQLDWLKKISPFGWSDLIDSVLDPQPIWIIPSVILAGTVGLLGLYFVSHRDYGTSILPQRTATRSRFYFLTSPVLFLLRQKKWTYFWWFIATLAMAVFMTALASLVSSILHDSSSLGPLAALPPEKITLLFVGESFMLVSLILLAMTIVEWGSLRRDEAKQYVDVILVGPVRRHIWLCGRIFVVLCAALAITILSSIAIWSVAETQAISFTIVNAINCGIAVSAAVILLLGFGVFLYGVRPRLVIVGMTVVVGWAFVVDIVRNLFHLDEWVTKTSIISYIPVDPSKALDWGGVISMTAIGIGLAVVGIIAFGKRDIIGE